jgi:hypothetical protein
MALRTETGRTLLSTGEASEISGLTHTHIGDLARHGIVEAQRVGHIWMVYEDALDAYLAKPKRAGRKSKRPPAPR